MIRFLTWLRSILLSVVSGLANFEIFGTSPAEFTEFIKADIEKSARIIQAAGAKLD